MAEALVDTIQYSRVIHSARLHRMGDSVTMNLKIFLGKILDRRTWEGSQVAKNWGIKRCKEKDDVEKGLLKKKKQQNKRGTPSFPSSNYGNLAA